MELSSEFRRISVFGVPRVDLKLLLKDLMILDSEGAIGWAVKIGRSVGKQALSIPAFVSMIDQ